MLTETLPKPVSTFSIFNSSLRKAWLTILWSHVGCRLTICPNNVRAVRFCS